MLLFVGLGNPGPRYARNRHNAGFEILDALARAADAPSWRDKFHGDFSRAILGKTEVALLRPMTFMNDSGRSVRAAMSFFHLPVSDLLVVHDELDLPFGTLRLKEAGGHAGHNGLRSIFEHVGNGDFHRMRVGIGRPPAGWNAEMADWVLSDFSAAERAALPDVVGRAVKALVDVGERGIAASTNALNTRPKAKKEEPG
jgi:peptidyl-tRNA hydrolase, PTH1 family